MFRYRKSELDANQGKFPEKCPFCHLDDPILNPKPRKIIYETEHALVVESIYPYDLWEFRDVTEHLLILPRRHAASLGDLNHDERREVIDLMCEFEAKGYDVYGRSQASVKRTVTTHQHTHLFKTSRKTARGALYLSKPYVVHKF